MKIGIIEDDPDKAASVLKFLSDECLRGDDSLEHWTCILDAVSGLMESSVDFLIIDIVLPLRNDDSAALRDGGANVLREVLSNGRIHRPKYILGLTEFEAVAVETADIFNEVNWHLVEYRSSDTLWKERIAAVVEHVRAQESDQVKPEYHVDFAILTALLDPEFRQVNQVFPELSPDTTCRYFPTWHQGSIETVNGERKIVAASAGTMGCSAAAILTQRIIHRYRPRFIILLGIAAGMRGRTNIGDVIGADYVFTHDSGKRKTVDSKVVFEPSPVPISANSAVMASIRQLADDGNLIDTCVHLWPAQMPDRRVRLRVGPLACGSAVVAASGVMEELAARHDRKLLGLDMESHGVLMACESEQNPQPVGLVIKGVSDFADESKEDNFQPFAAFMSAMIARRLIVDGVLDTAYSV